MVLTLMDRIYLDVPLEEHAGVKAAGAVWDGAAKRWYVPEQGDVAKFSRWLNGGDAGESEFGMSSEEAFVVSAATACLSCGAEIEVICLYCETGFDEEMGETIQRVTVSNVWDMDERLMGQLAEYRFYRRIGGAEAGADSATFANHCEHCGAVQDEYRLHSEPGDVFFSVTEAEPGSVTFTPLVGLVRLSGDFGFGI